LLGRNLVRIATFVAIDPDDVSALLSSIDYVVGELRK
jgi:phosphoserine aminotransferase